jgi:hypothetical protein
MTAWCPGLLGSETTVEEVKPAVYVDGGARGALGPW